MRLSIGSIYRLSFPYYLLSLWQIYFSFIPIGKSKFFNLLTYFNEIVSSFFIYFYDFIIYHSRFLHRYLPELHKLHHCCIIPSTTTNMMFHPLDLLVEFGGPVLSAIFINLYILRDPFAMMIAFTGIVDRLSQKYS